MLGLTQKQMAEIIGVTFQQAHKYEKGVNLLTAGRLYALAHALGVEVSYFFEGMDGSREFELNPRQRMLLDLTQFHFSAEPRASESRLRTSADTGRRRGSARARRALDRLVRP
ncbi:MAG: helix-turn-helix transcriptional regulator [Geminicoccaceae bacterium]